MKTCVNCGKQIKRGEQWISAIGLYFHLACTPLVKEEISAIKTNNQTSTPEAEK